MSLAPAIAHAATEAKDPRFDGVFFVGVTTTDIYCRTVCPARTPKPENRRFFASAAAAEKAGFRPCLVCRPEAAPGAAPIDQAARLAAAALSRIAAGALEEAGLDALADELGVTGRHLRRVCLAEFGAAPIDLAQTHRLLTAKRLLAETNAPLAQIAFASGFRSVRRFNAVFLERYGLAPSQMRARAPKTDDFALKLAARAPWAPAPAFAFLAERALSGIEEAGPQAYRRTLSIGGAQGRLEIAATSTGLALSVEDALFPSLRPLIAMVRAAFDLDADVTAIDAHLARDAALAEDVAAEPAVRLIGALDPFEVAVRAVLGQQVTVAAGRSLCERLAAETGAALPGEGLSRLFPTPEAIATFGAARIAALGMPLKRAETLARLARAAADGALPLRRGAVAAGRAGLSEIGGIGPWTIEYVALRGLGDPDAFPASDAAILRAYGGDASRAADTWRPFRAYAAMRLWRRAARLKGR